MRRGMNTLYRKAAARLPQLPLIAGALVFLPVWTLNYREGWLLLAVFFACAIAITWDLATRVPSLLERRLKAGPGDEREPVQKVAVRVANSGAFLAFAAIPVLSAVDHRMGWSQAPASIVLLGDALIVIAYIGCYFVLKANTYSAATIQVSEGQTLVSTGPYAFVRHPMYSWGLVVIWAFRWRSARCGAHPPPGPQRQSTCARSLFFWPGHGGSGGRPRAARTGANERRWIGEAPSLSSAARCSRTG